MFRQLISRYHLTLLLSLSILFEVSAQNELNVLKGNWLEYTDAANSLYHHLSAQAIKLLEERTVLVSKIQTTDDWKQRQQFVREKLSEAIGPFPEKTPLNAKVVRTVDKGSFTIEHIIFESQPGFYVTSSLFLPSGLKKGDRYPAIIYCSGHSADGYRSSVYIHVILNLVKKGFIVFAFDPVGQGERLEYFDPQTGKSSVGGPTMEHSYPGAQAFLTGSSQAFFMVWDGIRAIDYLISRKEVDPARIGITGRSGGGTQSAYIAAFDGRIYASAPENYLTNFTRLLQTIGPQDAEQNLFGFIRKGLDHPDFLIVRAPKPALMITTSGDMFSIQGALETEKEVKEIYRSYGKDENFSRVEDDAPHASTLLNRQAMYSFFRKHLNNPGSSDDEQTPALTPEELRVTTTGQLSASIKGETVFSINRRLTLKLEDELEISRSKKDNFIPEVGKSARKLSGYADPGNFEKPVLTGRIRRDGYLIDKFFLKGEGSYVIPYLLFRPLKPSGKMIIWLNPDGKSTDAAPNGNIERMVRNGFTVLAPDLPGSGELGSGTLKGDANFKGVSHNLWYLSMLAGGSITGLQAGDVARLIKVLKDSNGDAAITGYAVGAMGPVLLHAAVFSREIENIVIDRSYLSFRSLCTTKFYNPAFIMSSVPGALKEYDLTDLAGCLAPRKLLIRDPVDAAGGTSDTGSIEKDLGNILDHYKNGNASDRLLISNGAGEDEFAKLLITWLK